MFVIWLIYNRLATLVRSALETHVGQGLPFRFQFESLFPQRFPLSIVSRRLGRLRLRGSSLRSRAQAAYPADDRAAVLAGSLPVGGRRKGNSRLVRGCALEARQNGGDLVTVRGARGGGGVKIRRGGDWRGVELGEVARAGRGAINIVSERGVASGICAGGPSDFDGVLRVCWRGAPGEGQ